MQKLSDLMKMRLPAHQLGQAAKSAEVIFKANEWLDRQESLPSSTVKAYRFERGNLFVSAENSVLMQEMWALKEPLLENLNRSFAEKPVKKIVIKCLTIE